MTRDTYLAQIKWLTSLLDSWNKQIDAIADHEAKLAQTGQANDNELSAAKMRLIEKTDALIDRLQELHDEFGG